MNKLNSQIKLLLSEQMEKWELASKNFSNLDKVLTKSFSFGHFEVKVQFNPARIVSSGAKVDAKTIAERKCFLCANNRPTEQTSVDAGDYSILVNPFPIFPEHFTIARKEHVEQQIKPYFADMLELAKELDEFLIFYNGPKCGASAPDHMHFQAGTKNYLPLVNDYKRLKDSHAELLVESENLQLYSFNNYLRTVYCIESTDIENAKDAFEKLYSHFEGAKNTEPMLNLVCIFEQDKWFVFVLPRKAFRPWQYSAEPKQQLLISPATVELCGIFIVPYESHFHKITKNDIISILEQTAL